MNTISLYKKCKLGKVPLGRLHPLPCPSREVNTYRSGESPSRCVSTPSHPWGPVAIQSFWFHFSQAWSRTVHVFLKFASSTQPVNVLISPSGGLSGRRGEGPSWACYSHLGSSRAPVEGEPGTPQWARALSPRASTFLSWNLGPLSGRWS